MTLKNLHLSVFAATLAAAGINGNAYAQSSSPATSPTLFKIYMKGLTGPAVAASGPASPVSVFTSNLSYSSFVLLSDGSVWAAGLNTSGNLGDGTTAARSTFKKVISSGAVQVAPEYSHTVVLKSDGSVWTTGSNGGGELGDGTTTAKSLFEQVIPSGITRIGVGGSLSYAIDSAGTLWATGYGTTGQFGNGTTLSHSSFISVLTGVVDVSAGMYHTMAVKSDGSVWGTGYGGQGERGDGATSNVRSWSEAKTGSPFFTGGAKVSAGYEHTMVLRSDNTVWGAGLASEGALSIVGGAGPTFLGESSFQGGGVITNVVQLAAGNDFTFALKSDGTLWAAGYNAQGQLGNGTTNNITYFTQVLSNVASVAAGSTHALAMKTDGTLWATGSNQYGQLGTGDTTSHKSWTQVTLPSQ